jgi:hypothetical protein
MYSNVLKCIDNSILVFLHFLSLQVVKKLAGHGHGTAAWATNIGNEYGQVLISVLTASEGHGLEAMGKGIVKRYANAGV